MRVNGTLGDKSTITWIWLQTLAVMRYLGDFTSNYNNLRISNLARYRENTNKKGSKTRFSVWRCMLLDTSEAPRSEERRTRQRGLHEELHHPVPGGAELRGRVCDLPHTRRSDNRTATIEASSLPCPGPHVNTQFTDTLLPFWWFFLFILFYFDIYLSLLHGSLLSWKMNQLLCLLSNYLPVAVDVHL